MRTLTLYTITTFVMLSASQFVHAEEVGVCGHVSSIEGDRDSVVIVRDHKNVKPMFFQDLLCGDVLRVTAENASVDIQFTDGSTQRLVKADNSFTIIARGDAISAKTKLWDLVGKWFTNRNDYRKKSLVSRGNPAPALAIKLGRMQDVEQTIKSGARDLRLTWEGGNDDYEIKIATKDGTSVAITGTKISQLQEHVFSAALTDVRLSPGPHVIEVFGPKQGKVSAHFNVTDTDLKMCTPGDSAIANIINITRFAGAEGGKYAWETYSLLANMKLDAKHKFLLEKELEAGRRIPSFKPRGSKLAELPVCV